MFYVSEPIKTVPEVFKNKLQGKTYEALNRLGIPFERVDADEAITMEDCILINDKLNMKMVKTLFLCNSQKTAYYLFITCGDKPFKSKEFSKALDVARLSFGPSEKMEEKLGTVIGAATVFSALLDSAKNVQIVFDNDVVSEDWYGCSDGTTTGYMKVATWNILHKFLPYTGKTYKIVRV